MIARYHRHRIAAAIFEVTLSAQVTITHQRNPFPLPFEAIPPKLRARSPVTSVFQIVGSLLLLYCPYYVTIVWNSSVATFSHNLNSDVASTSMQVPCTIMLIAFVLIHLTVFINIIIYGLKSKVIRNSLKNYWRKQKTKNEMNNEIQARTPSTCGNSRRPSINTALNLSRSASHRRLSETYVNLNQLTNGNRPQIKRIASELSWQPNNLPDALLPHASSDTLRIPHNESIESFDVDSAGGSGSGGAGGCGGDGSSNTCESNDIRLKMMRSFRDKPLTMKSLSTTSLQPINTTSGRSVGTSLSSKLPVTYFQSTCKEFRRYLQISTKKMFRIDLNESHKRNEPLSPLRSPQILITADSDDSDPNVHSSPISVQQKLDSSTSFMETEFDWKTHPIDDGEKSDDNSDDDDNLPFDRCAMQIKRSRSLDEPDVSKCSSSSCGGGGGEYDEPREPLLLSWPPVRKMYKSVPNVSPFGDDQCVRPKLVL